MRDEGRDAMSTQTEIVRELYGALSRGDIMNVMGHVTRDIRWAVSASDRESVPWFGVYEGRANLPKFFEALSQVEFSDFTLLALVGDEETVVSWLHVAFTTPIGKSVDMQEVQVWRFTGDRVSEVHTLLDTAAVAAAFAQY
jgi:ketosteroid isomerase-like protein